MSYNVRQEFKRDWYLLIIILAVFVVGIIAYPHLPDEIVSHWNISGQPDDYMNKLTGITLIPGIILGVYLLMLFSPLVDPRRDSYEKFIKGYRLMRLTIVLLLAGLQLVALAYNLGYIIEVGKIVTIGLGVLFIIIGNYLPQVRHNYFVGIKVPWTLASEKVWRKTHRLAGKLFVISGIGLLFSFFVNDTIRFYLVLILVLGSSVISMIYSYFIYRKEVTK